MSLHKEFYLGPVENVFRVYSGSNTNKRNCTKPKYKEQNHTI